MKSLKTFIKKHDAAIITLTAMAAAAIVLDIFALPLFGVLAMMFDRGE
ncbi:MAG: hypothetical protein HUK08_08405 [Bacteroidaceae bacterium]|nr:hypothetical protein [Bacteroidaceae bacterium]